MGASALARMNLFLWLRRTCSYPVEAQSDRNDTYGRFDGGCNKGVDGLGREEGVWGYGQRFARCLFGREDGRDWLFGCWLPPRGGSLERVAPSKGRLPREGVQPRRPAELSSAPGLAQVWQFFFGVRGSPRAFGGAACRPRLDREALGDRSEQRKAGPDGRPCERAHTARTRRAHGAPRHVSRRAPARFPTCEPRISRRVERRVSRRAERRVFWRAERRVFRRAERRDSRHANGASTDARTSASSSAHTVRLRGV